TPYAPPEVDFPADRRRQRVTVAGAAAKRGASARTRCRPAAAARPFYRCVTADGGEEARARRLQGRLSLAITRLGQLNVEIAFVELSHQFVEPRVSIQHPPVGAQGGDARLRLYPPGIGLGVGGDRGLPEIGPHIDGRTLIIGPHR